MVLYTLIVQVKSNNLQGFPTIPTIFKDFPEESIFDLNNEYLSVSIFPFFLKLIPIISPSKNDVTTILRLAVFTTRARFDAVAPYTATAVGIHSNLGRRPINERTARNENIAIFYCTLRILAKGYPEFSDFYSNKLKELGLDPEDTHEVSN